MNYCYITLIYDISDRVPKALTKVEPLLFLLIPFMILIYTNNIILGPQLFIPAFAQVDDTDASSPAARQYTIGVYIINIGKIDLQTGSYDLDFYIWLASDEEGVNFVQNAPKIDYMNAQRITVEPSRIEPDYWEARVKGTFLKNMDFRNYPFDKQQATVEVEGFETVDKLVFVPDARNSGFDYLINVPGWNLGNSYSEVAVHDYPDESYSRYIFTFDIERAPLSSFLKTIFPIIIITTIAMLAFWMSPTNFPPRIGLAASTLLAAVAAHLNAANQLPPIGYLTLIDKVMIVVYALFLNNLLSMVLQMRLMDHKKEEQAVKVNSKMRKLMPVIIGVILAILIPFDLRLV